MTFDEIMKMIKIACCHNFYNGEKGIQDTIVKCATEIYIEQMRLAKEG